jgi:protein-L-isoaspartate(D-aspartate) O-methyltransferase
MHGVRTDGLPIEYPVILNAGRLARRDVRMLTTQFEQQREQLVDNELRRHGVTDEVVLDAMRTVPREAFVADEFREFAYRNAPLPIGKGQTISQPLVVAHMAEALALRPDDSVLEVGAGSGYAAAVLSHLAKQVVTIERHGDLADAARRRLKKLHYDNVSVISGDGTLGYAAAAPFDAIVVAAAGPKIPPLLLEQLKIGGRLVMPVGQGDSDQRLVRATRRTHDRYEYEDLGAVRFVPLIG